jgi:hypothetical protein
MIKPSRNISALVLTLVYLLIMLSPLAPLALGSKQVAHAVTGECAGDCGTCGCSAERQASHTCCCALKKQQEYAKNSGKACCKESGAGATASLSRACPCGTSKMSGLWGAEKFVQLPYRYRQTAPRLLESGFICFPESRPADRCTLPFKPPPKSARLC